MTSTGVSCLTRSARSRSSSSAEGKLQPLRRLPAGERVGEEYAQTPVRSVLDSRAQRLHRKPYLQMRDDQRSGHNLEAEHALGGGALQERARQGAGPAFPQVGLDAAQRLREVSPRAAAGIQDVDVLRREPSVYAEVVPERLVHPGDHIPHDFGRGVPNAHLFAEAGVERLQKRFVEIGHGLALVEFGEEGVLVHPVERGGGPVQHFHQVRAPQVDGSRELLEHRLENGRVDIPNRRTPVETPNGGRSSPRPENPRGEHSVEKRLHQRRAEE